MKEINLNEETIIHESLTLNKILRKFMNDHCSYRAYNCNDEELTNLCNKYNCHKYSLILLENNISVEVNMHLYPESLIQIPNKINYDTNTFIIWFCVLNKKYYVQINPVDNYFNFSIFNIIYNHRLCSGFVTTEEVEILPCIKIGKFNFAIQYGNLPMLSSLINTLKKKMNKYYFSYLESYQLLKKL